LFIKVISARHENASLFRGKMAGESRFALAIS